MTAGVGLALAPPALANSSAGVSEEVFREHFEDGGWAVNYGAWNVVDGRLEVLSSVENGFEEPGIGPQGGLFSPPFRVDFDLAFLTDDVGTYAGRHAGVLLANKVGNRQDAGVNGYTAGFASRSWAGYRFQRSVDGQVSDITGTLQGPAAPVGTWRHWSVEVGASELVLHVDGQRIGSQAVAWGGPVALTFWTGTFGGKTAVDNVVIQHGNGAVLFRDRFDGAGVAGWDSLSGDWWVASGALRVLANSCDCATQEPDIGVSALTLRPPFEVEFDLAFLSEAGWFAGKHAGLLLADTLGSRFDADVTGFAVGYADRWGTGGTGYRLQRIVNGVEGPGTPFSGGASPSVGAWHHWKVRVDESGLTLAIDGTVLGTAPADLGRSPVHMTFWTGTNGGIVALDNVVVRAAPELTAERVAAIVEEDGGRTRGLLMDVLAILGEAIRGVQMQVTVLSQDVARGFSDVLRAVRGVQKTLDDMGLTEPLDVRLAAPPSGNPWPGAYFATVQLRGQLVYADLEPLVDGKETSSISVTSLGTPGLYVIHVPPGRWDLGSHALTVRAVLQDHHGSATIWHGLGLSPPGTDPQGDALGAAGATAEAAGASLQHGAKAVENLITPPESSVPQRVELLSVSQDVPRHGTSAPGIDAPVAQLVGAPEPGGDYRLTWAVTDRAGGSVALPAVGMLPPLELSLVSLPPTDLETPALRVEVHAAYTFDAAAAPCVAGQAGSCVAAPFPASPAWIASSGVSASLDLTIRVLDSDGNVVEERTLSVPLAGQALGWAFKSLPADA